MMKNMTATTEPKDKPIEELKALRERVAALEGPIDPHTASTTIAALSPWPVGSDERYMLIRALGFSLEAMGYALALVGKVLPGWYWTVASTNTEGEDRPWADIASPNYVNSRLGLFDNERADASAPTAPLAIILALLDARLAEEE